MANIKYPEATDYIFINALSRASGLKLNTNDLEESLSCVFDIEKIYKVPDYYYLKVIKTRFPCTANFCDPDFHKSDLFDLMESMPNNYFLLLNAYSSGKDALYLAFNYNYMQTLKHETKTYLNITYKKEDKVKQLLSIDSLRI